MESHDKEVFKMLASVTVFSPRVGIIDLPEFWQDEADTLVSVHDHFYGPNASPSDFTPHLDEGRLRMELMRASPRLQAFADQLRGHLENDFYALVLNRFGLAAFDLELRRRLLYCFALAVGSPTPTDKIAKRIVWDVRARKLPPGHVPTISENSYEAELHTDTQYYPDPEKYVLLYVVKPASCGGVSLLIDGNRLKARLAETEQGRWALGFLSRRILPFRIPTSYTTTGKQETVEITYARIFSGSPTIRYRKDTLEAGLAAVPEFDTSDVRHALTVLQSVLEDPKEMVVTPLPADSMLLMNNHEGLHGRTEFRDPERHLIRIRIAIAQSELHRDRNSLAVEVNLEPA